MTRYQLAKLIQWAGKTRAHKQLQKAMFLLQESGCRLDLDFELCRGPYSRDLAGLVSQETASGLLNQSTSHSEMGTLFGYELSKLGISNVRKYEKTRAGKAELLGLKPFRSRLKLLMGKSLRMLELAALIAFCHRRDNETWKQAARSAGWLAGEDVSVAVQQAHDLAEPIPV